MCLLHCLHMQYMTLITFSTDVLCRQFMNALVVMVGILAD